MTTAIFGGGVLVVPSGGRKGRSRTAKGRVGPTKTGAAEDRLLAIVKGGAPLVQGPLLTEPMHLHFLCNTLHVMQGLVHRDPQRVEQMLDEMCELLHHLLHSTRVADVPLRDEIAALQAYASLQKLRFQERLEFEFDVEPAALDRRIPGFLLYPLIENAVKFGLTTAPPPVVVRVSAQQQPDRLIVTVANTGRWVDAESENAAGRGHGLALQHLRRRLLERFGGQHSFTVGEDEGDGWVRARLELPSP